MQPNFECWRSRGAGRGLACVGFGLACWAGIGAANAALVSIENPSFEADFAGPGTFPVLIPQGWSLVDPNGIVEQSADAVGVVNPTGTTFFQSGVPDGNNAALIYLEGDRGGGEVSLEQTLSVTLQPNTRYRLMVGVGNIASGFGAPPFTQFFDLDGFPGYRIQLRAGNSVIAEDNNSLAGSLAEGTFGTSEIEVTIGATHGNLGEALSIRLTNLNQLGTVDEPGIEVDFDHVRLDAAAVPEPKGVVAWAGLTLLGWIAARRGVALRSVGR